MLASDNSGNNEFEGGIREFVRKNVALWRKRQEHSEPPADTHENISMLVQRVAGASISEIDNLIEELRTMRERPQATHRVVYRPVQTEQS